MAGTPFNKASGHGWPQLGTFGFDEAGMDKSVAPGEVVVTEGLDKLRDGASIARQAAPGAGKGDQASSAKPAHPGATGGKKRP